MINQSASFRSFLQNKVFWSILSFLLPFSIWSAVSYLPFVWHPLVQVEEPGSVAYFQKGDRVSKEDFVRELSLAQAEGRALPQGIPSNPVYLPAPHQVLWSLWNIFHTKPRLKSEPWFHQALWTSIKVIFLGFLFSSLLALPLGLLAGSSAVFCRLTEPFIEFFRYLPAPAFGSLAVAVLGIHLEPKIAIIFIGTFFQQVLITSASTQRLDPTIVETARTLGAKRFWLFFRVIVPGVMYDLYRDLRILLGWAWTYLIVAEVVGTSTGITWFINQQAKYRVYDKVYAAIFIIGIIGLSTDWLLARLGKRLFPWCNLQD